MSLHICTCGGTIDKIYFDALSEYQIGAPAIGQLLDAMGFSETWHLTAIMRKDSLDMTDQDRALIRRTVADCPEDRILITHGTDTMLQTAAVLEDIADKRIVLTGAMQPAAMRDTDAIFNIGFALGVLLSGDTTPGTTLVAMNGRAKAPHELRKDRDAGRFVDA